MKKSRRISIISSAILIGLLVGACGILPSERINDATSTSMPTFTPIPPTVTPTSTPDFVFVTDIPTPLPTPVPPPILTPDAIQLERWQEYQTELAKVLLYGYGPEASKDALCEWDILGRSSQEVYVYTYCVIRGGPGNDGAAVVYLEADGSIQKVRQGIKLPTDVREKLDRYYFNGCVYCGRPEELRMHLNYRETHPVEPPLIILSETSTTIPIP